MTQSQTTSRFSDLGIDEKLLSILAKKRFDIPTPIQHQVIPAALQGKDVVGIAQTGTGKTLAFGIPIIQRLIKNNGQALILVPTRELAIQVDQALNSISSSLGLRLAVIIGGVPQDRQVQALKRNPHIVIATPGRLDDLMKQKFYKLDNVNSITLDEADRMLDIGFLPQIKRILQTAPQNRQTMLFSATMPGSISSLASAFMKLPLRIEIAPQGTSAENVEQEVFVVVKNDKIRLLDSLLQQYKNEKVLIFSRTKYGAKKIALDIRSMNHTATEIHSNRSQAQRKTAMEGFTRGKFRIMVATDIAARGIDVRDIGLVINFDLPDNSEDYVHRIGRTGRAGRSGKAISFVTPSEKADVRKIERLIRKSLPVLSLPTLPAAKPRSSHQGQEQDSFSSRGGSFRRGRGQRFDNKQSGKKSGEGFNKKRRDNNHRTGQSGRDGGSAEQSGGRKPNHKNRNSSFKGRHNNAGYKKRSPR